MARFRIFNKVPVEVANRSGHNLDHSTSFTANVGTLLPCFVEPAVPGEKLSLSIINHQTQLPPLVTDFYGHVEVRLESFFVPYRILYGGWQDFITHDNGQGYPNVQEELTYSQIHIPGFKTYFHDSETGFDTNFYDSWGPFFGPCSLSDMLGVKIDPEAYDGIYGTFPNLLPWIAYHKIFESYYMDWHVQNRLFVKPKAGNSVPTGFRYLPYIHLDNDDKWVRPDSYDQTISATPGSSDPSVNVDMKTNDGRYFFELRQRLFDKDYFTSATLTPNTAEPTYITSDIGQYFERLLSTNFFLEGNVNGDPLMTEAGTLAYVLDSTSLDSSMADYLKQAVSKFSMSQLYTANAVDQFKITNNIVGNKYDDQIFAHFGVRPSSAVIDYPIYLGSKRFPIYTKGIYQQSLSDVSSDRNPFNSVGTKYGNAQSLGDGNLFNNFEATEHGLFMTFYSIVPQRQYGTGTRRYLLESKYSEFPFPTLSSVGDQEISKLELIQVNAYDNMEFTSDFETFAYTQRYAHYKTHPDEVHGLLRDGQSMQHFQLQSSFTDVDSTNYGTSFLEIPVDFLDQVYAYQDQGTNNPLQREAQAWVNINFKVSKVSPLPDYSRPTLSPMKDMHTVMVNLRGSRL